MTTNIFAKLSKNISSDVLNNYEIGIVLNNSIPRVTDDKKKHIWNLVSENNSLTQLPFKNVKNMLGLLYLAQSNQEINLSKINAYTPAPKLNNQ